MAPTSHSMLTVARIVSLSEPGKSSPVRESMDSPVTPVNSRSPGDGLLDGSEPGRSTPASTAVAMAMPASVSGPGRDTAPVKPDRA